jgi:hypothetical protein
LFWCDVVKLSLVEQELSTLLEHLSSLPFLMRFVLLHLNFYMYVLLIVVCPLYLFFWPLCFLFFFGTRIQITSLGTCFFKLFLYFHYCIKSCDLSMHVTWFTFNYKTRINWVSPQIEISINLWWLRILIKTFDDQEF